MPRYSDLRNSVMLKITTYPPPLLGSSFPFPTQRSINPSIYNQIISLDVTSLNYPALPTPLRPIFCTEIEDYRQYTTFFVQTAAGYSVARNPSKSTRKPPNTLTVGNVIAFSTTKARSTSIARLCTIF